MDGFELSGRRSSAPHLHKIGPERVVINPLGNRGDSIRHAVSGPIWYYGDDKYKYGVSYLEYISRVLVTYDKISLSCGVTALQKRLAMVFMLKYRYPISLTPRGLHAGHTKQRYCSSDFTTSLTTSVPGYSASCRSTRYVNRCKGHQGHHK